MKFEELYTTNDKIEKEKDLLPEKQKEKCKTILSNDAFAVGSMVERLALSVSGVIRGLYK